MTISCCSPVNLLYDVNRFIQRKTVVIQDVLPRIQFSRELCRQLHDADVEVFQLAEILFEPLNGFIRSDWPANTICSSGEWHCCQLRPYRAISFQTDLISASRAISRSIIGHAGSRKRGVCNPIK